LKLGEPVLKVPLWNRAKAAVLVLMPEAAVYEEYLSTLGKHDVRSAR
jgi:hypothetical protein